MTLAIKTEPPPLRQDPDGTVRVGGTPVLLDVVVRAFQDGASAEEIVDWYPSLSLADVYATIAYYLRDKALVDAYVARRQAEADRLRAEIEANSDASSDASTIRERLLARRKARES